MPSLFFKPGKTILSSPSSYQLLFPLKESASRQVFKALHHDPETGISRPVVVKVFLEESSFKEEFESLSQAASSSRCVRLLGMESFEGRKALVLEYIRGVSLFQLREGFLLSQQEISYLLHSIYQGLLDLKARGLCHGDLSLDNVLIDEEARVCLIDFGKANYKGERQGTPPFIAPEILRGLGGGVSFSSDLYSLGVIEQSLRFSESFSGLKGKEVYQYLADKSPLLSSDPKKRLFPIKSKTSAELFLKKRGELNKLTCKVKDLLSVLEERRVSTVKTKALVDDEKKAKKTWSRLSLSFFYAWYSQAFHKFLKGFSLLRSFQLSVLLLLSSLAPWQAIPSPHKLKLYTKEWFFVQVGDAQFYSPAVFFLKSGSHSIYWKNKRESGQLRLNLFGKRSVFLNDKLFLRKRVIKKKFYLSGGSL